MVPPLQGASQLLGVFSLHCALFRVDAARPRLGRAFGPRRLRAKPTPTTFGTNRAFAHALPPSLRAPLVPFSVPACFVPLPLL
jgi:hypothetical protein